jgi:hypothetical protein
MKRLLLLLLTISCLLISTLTIQQFQNRSDLADIHQVLFGAS